MNVELLLKEEGVEKLLADENWRNTDYYEIDSWSEYFGCANLIVLNRQVTTEETTALIYLLQRLYYGSNAFNKNAPAISANELLHWLIGGGYIGANKEHNTGTTGSSEGVRLHPQTAASKVEETIQVLLQSDEAVMFKNGNKISRIQIFNPSEVNAVTAFMDKEDDYLYFIETDKAWFYFSWGTNV